MSKQKLTFDDVKKNWRNFKMQMIEKNQIEKKKNELEVKEKQQITPSQRFTERVIKEFTEANGQLQLSDFQKNLVQNYFISIDMTLQLTETKRKNSWKKDDKEKPAYTWQNINMKQLSFDVVSNARLGLDPLQPNHIFFIPHNSKHTKLYSMTPIVGYRGIEIKHTKYALNAPKDIRIELVYENDEFKSFKKDRNNKIESYEFCIKNEFDRGKVKGGFAYFEYNDEFENKIYTISLREILKRKPEKASAEFWGGEVPNYVNGKKEGTKQIDGWYDEMCYKTVARWAYNKITIDSQKIDDNYRMIKSREIENQQLIVENEIEENANSKVIDITDSKLITEPNTQELPEEYQESESKPESNISDTEQEELSKPSVLDDLQPDF